ncbi:M1 family metallopeptidase [Bacteroidota bacterium]
MKNHSLICLLFLLIFGTIYSQNPVFTRQDTLRGSITEERKWWDLVYYHLDIKVDPADSSITGKNTIHYKVLEEHSLMQIDLQPPLIFEKAMQNGRILKVRHEGNAHFVSMPENQKPGELMLIDIYYHGKPKLAYNPPWDGGISWETDQKGKPFIASSCQGIGASIWWPCKDHPYDEPDSMLISVNVPEELMNVSNGRLRSLEKKEDKTKTFHWFVSNPINHYGVNINIADYAHFSEKYDGEKGILDCDYYVLKENLSKAKKQFMQVKLMLDAFEYWFGPYPFYEDGYKLVEVPYAGMEHQSSVTYGNGYRNGFLGSDVSNSGWGHKFDFIIIHESAHEWFANSISNKDVADMWMHESFANYAENLFVEYHFGKKAGSEYVLGSRMNIKNDRPIVGIYNVNYEGSGDMYYKGGNLFHTLRQIVNDDKKWRNLFREMNKEFFNQTVTGKQIEDFICMQLHIDLSKFFDQYLRDVRIPRFEYTVTSSEIHYRWNNCINDFEMPVKVYINEEEKWLMPSIEWQILKTKSENSELKVDPNFYVSVLNITGN